jgi:uncharacterized protein YoxC
MNSLPHANLFFLVSTIGFVIVVILLVIGLVYLIQLFKSVLRITKKIEKDIDNIGDTTKDFIAQLWNSTIFSMIFGKRKKRKSVE